MSPKKVIPEAKAPELDMTRELLADPRDPRSAECWPCFKNHNGCVKGSNKYGAWTLCSVCNLKMSYIPRMGCPGKYMEKVDHSHVKKALSKLQSDLNGMKPNHLLVKTAVDFVAIQEKYDLEVKGIKEAPASSTTPQSSQDLLAALTPEERLTLESRVQRAHQPEPSEISMNPNDEWEISGN